MDATIRTELVRLLREEGRAVCCMPRSFAAMLRERCPDAEAQVKELTIALERGTVRALQHSGGPPADREDLARQLVAAGLSDDRARWAVESWAAALQMPEPESVGRRSPADWNTMEAPGGPSFTMTKQLLVCLAVVAVAGFLGGAYPAYRVAGASESTRDHLIRDVRAHVSGAELTVLFPLLGGLGAVLGGVFAWCIGHGTWFNSEPHRIPIVRLFLTSVGTFFGGAIGSFGGVVCFGIPGVPLFACLGAGLIGVLYGFVIRWWWMPYRHGHSWSGGGSTWSGDDYSCADDASYVTGGDYGN